MTNIDEKQQDVERLVTAPSGALLRGLAIIRAIVNAHAPMTQGELADRTGLDASTTLRLAQTLVTEGYLVRLEPGKRYCAGPQSLSMLSPYHPLNTFRRETAEVLQKARDEVGATVALVLFLGSERLIVDMAQGNEGLAPFYDTWLRTPVHAAASGKILLASLGPKQKREVLGPLPLVKVAENTITDLAKLDKELNAIRENGYSISIGEVHGGMNAVAAAIEHNRSVVGCIVSVGTSTRLPAEDCDHVGTFLTDAAKLIAAATPSVRSLAHYVGV